MRRFSLPAKQLRRPRSGRRPATPICPNPLNSNPKPFMHSYEVPLANLLKRPRNEALLIRYIRIYAKNGLLHEATQLFDEMPEVNCSLTTASLNHLLSALCEKREQLYMVKDVLLKSQMMGIRVDGSTFRILIEALCRNGKATFAIEIMSLMGLFECDPDARMYSLVLQSLCKDSTSWSDVIAFVREMRNAGFLPSMLDRDIVIDFLVKGGKVDEAYYFVSEMKNDGTKPDVHSYNKVLSGFCKAGRFDMVDEVFDEMIIMGLVPNVCTYEIYIGGLAKRRDVDGMVKMVRCMERTGLNANVQIYNMMIGEFMRSGQLNKARELMDEMVRKGIKWNSGTLNLYYGRYKEKTVTF